MNIVDLYTSDWVIEKLESRHGVQVEEVWEVLQSDRCRFFRARQGSHLSLGQTDAGRFLAVFFFTEPADGGVRARIATARDMDEAERRRFSRK